MMKPCEVCGTAVEVKGPRRYCEPCGKRLRGERAAEYRRVNAEKLADKSRAWAVRNPEKVAARRARDKVEKADVIKQREAARRKRDADKRRESAKAYYWANRERVLERHRSDDGRRKARDRMRKTMQDPLRRLHSNIGRMVREALQGRKNGRSWERLVGYTRADLAAHLERQFAKGMTWNNMGEWEVDHIVPRCAFRFSGPDDPAFKACWSLTNLRPLWTEENRAKSGNRLHLV